MPESTGSPVQVARYRILGELGRGAMGRVYLAHDPNTDRQVALKLIATPGERPADEDAEARRRFMIEARAAGRLQHPAIVTVYDAGTDEATGSPYLVMEWVPGRALAALLRDEGVLEWPRAVAIAAQIARALGHAHERGVVHRDVKPANILVTPDGQVKVADFGIAKFFVDSNTRTSFVVGTPSYMSPEQLRGELVDGRSDLFSLGAMLYEMVTGEAPFRSDSVAGIGYKIANVDPRPPTFLRRELPAELERVVLRALAKDPAARFQSGVELAEALDAVLREPASPRAETVREAVGPAPAAAPARVERVVAAMAGAAFLLLLGSAAYWWSAHAGRNGSSDGAAAGPASPVRPAADRSGRAATPAAPPARPPRAAGAAAPAGRAPKSSATLEILHHNRLRRASMTIWIDGERVWSSPLNVSKDVVEMVAGDRVRASLPVAPGAHTIEVRIVQPSARIDSRGAIRGDFAPGQSRWLRVVLLPYLPTLELEWES